MRRYIVAILLGCSSVSFGHSLSINVGGAVPITDIDATNICSGGVCGGKEKAGSTGLAIGGQYLYNLREDLGIGVEVNHISSGDKTSTTFIPGGDSTLSSQSTNVLAIGKISFITKGPVWPYFLLGLGFGSSNLKIESKPQAGFVWANTSTTETRQLVDSTKTAFAYALGLGLDVPVANNFFLGGEVRLQAIAKQTYDATQSGRTTFNVTGIDGPIGDVVVLARAGYKF